jgi:hypothetical protein
MTANPSPAALHKRRLSLAEWPSWVLLLVIVTLLWCTAYNRWTADAWKTPVAYGGDAWAVMANAKAFASGEVRPIVLKYPASLGAPFVANWNDYPSPAEGIFVWAGILVRFFGILAGSNLTVLSAHLLAAASFFFVARTLGYQRLLSITGAVLFSMSRYAFARSLSHIGPVFYWHIPLALLVVWWCVTPSPEVNDRRKILLCIVVAVLHGIQDPYFSAIFLQFLLLASIICLLRGEQWRRVLFPVFVAIIVLATCVAMNADTFYNRLVNGPNTEALVRDYSGLEIYALKPIELFLPVSHRISALSQWMHRAYLQRAYVLGEIGAAYLGVVGIAACGLLLLRTAHAVAKSNARSIPSHFWPILWVVLYSVIGGANSVFGLFGFVLFRGANRYSIVIFALLLLFLVRELTRLTRKWKGAAVAALAGFLIVFGFFDQTPRPPRRSDIARVRALVLSDARVVAALEEKLPPSAMIFELPVVIFPEAGPVREMQDYEHFRPYLQSHSLRFSYGSVKGRTRERWQSEAGQFGANRLVSLLERYGFSAILINKKAYEANAASLLSELGAAGRSEILCESSDFVCIELHPVAEPLLPPEFDGNWSPLEGVAGDNWRWSQGDSSIILRNEGAAMKQVKISFSLGTLKPRTVEISDGVTQLYQASLAENQSSETLHFAVSLPPGRNELRFRTDVPGELAGNGDKRKFAFNIKNFTIGP